MQDYVNVLPRSFLIILGYEASNLLENFHSLASFFFKLYSDVYLAGNDDKDNS